MTVATALVLMGTSVTTKASSLFRGSEVNVSKDNGNSFVLKHANELFSNNVMASPDHYSHSSHVSHASHASHASHSSHSSHYSGY